MKKMNSVKQTPLRCPFSNKRSRPILKFLKLGVQEEKHRGAGRSLVFNTYLYESNIIKVKIINII